MSLNLKEYLDQINFSNFSFRADVTNIHALIPYVKVRHATYPDKEQPADKYIRHYKIHQTKKERETQSTNLT